MGGEPLRGQGGSAVSLNEGLPPPALSTKDPGRIGGGSTAYTSERAGRFPVAGGTYEYGYRALGPRWGFTAGWLFLLAKTTSAAAAALGVAAYLGSGDARRVVAVAVVLLITSFVLAGIRPSTVVNVVLVSITVTALVTFGVSGLSEGQIQPIAAAAIGPGLLPAIAFLFVAYTGYGRIATLGEEVRSPRRTIPLAVVMTLLIAGVLYLLVALGGRGLGGPNWGAAVDQSGLSALAEPPWSSIVAVGAVTAMLGVLLNLILGLSRVWLAMGRRSDMPPRLADLDRRGSPIYAVACAAVPEVVEHEVTGFVCHDLRGMIECLERVPEISRDACRRHVARRFSAEIMTTQYERAYAAVVGDGMRAPIPA